MEEVIDPIHQTVVPPERVIVIDGEKMDIKLAVKYSVISDSIINPFNRKEYDDTVLTQFEEYRSKNMLTVEVINNRAKRVTQKRITRLFLDSFLCVGDLIVEIARWTNELNNILTLNPVDSEGTSLFDVDPETEISDLKRSDAMIHVTLLTDPPSSDTIKLEHYLSASRYSDLARVTSARSLHPISSSYESETTSSSDESSESSYEDVFVYENHVPTLVWEPVCDNPLIWDVVENKGQCLHYFKMSDEVRDSIEAYNCGRNMSICNILDIGPVAKDMVAQRVQLPHPYRY